MVLGTDSKECLKNKDREMGRHGDREKNQFGVRNVECGVRSPYGSVEEGAGLPTAPSLRRLKRP